MSQSKVYTIKSQNQVINSLILEIINTNSEEAFFVNENGDYEITDTYRHMIELEMQKILKIYHLEFPNLPYAKNRKLDIRIYKRSHIDGRFSNNALQFSSGIKSEFEKLRSGNLYGENIGYDIQDDGQVTYNPNGETKKMSTNLIDKGDGTPYILKQGEEIEHDFTDETGDLYYYINDCKYETYLFSIMPHEMAHAFGFTGGVFEGLTETVSREVSNKYGLMNFPFARKDLVELMQKVEKTIGRDKLVEHSHTFNGSKERVDKISKAIDEKINSDQKNCFEHFFDANTVYKEYDDKIEELIVARIEKGEITQEEGINILNADTTLPELTKNLFHHWGKLSDTLDTYIKQYPDALFKLGQTNIIGTDKDFEDVISFQQNEFNSLNRILEKIKEQILNQNSSFRNSLQSMVNDTVLYSTTDDTDTKSKNKDEIKKDINL